MSALQGQDNLLQSRASERLRQQASDDEIAHSGVERWHQRPKRRRTRSELHATERCYRGVWVHLERQNATEQHIECRAKPEYVVRFPHTAPSERLSGDETWRARDRPPSRTDP